MSSDVWTSGIYPLKLHEYLAAGRPVVSADLQSVRPFGHVLAIARSPQEWRAAIVQALNAGGVADSEARRAVACDNSWDHRVAILDGWLTDVAR